MTGFALFDTHVHLNDPQFESDREEVLRLCEEKGVARIVEIADSPAGWDRSIGLSRAYPRMIRCALGLHPYYADQWTKELSASLRRQADNKEVVAVGEIGLDYAKCKIPKEVQRSSFIKMLESADERRLPVVIHCREAYPDMMAILKGRYGARPSKRFHGVLHCFSGNKENALEAVRLGFALGVDGPITYPKNDALREAIKAAGLNYIVLETDSPYLPPQSFRGKRNDPSLLPEIAQRVAALFAVNVEECARETMQNGEDLFHRSRGIQ